jgi:UDP-N-acetylmuramoyl-tripeptide--D-alanyl-D-alanine ligase
VPEKHLEKLYSEEISLVTSPEYSDYVDLNLRKIRDYRKNFNLPVVGIAGAEGKTTTKRMLSAILSQRGEVLQTPLDCDSASTVTTTLLKLNENCKYCLIELGIINPNQFKLAVELSEPNIGIVTNVGEAKLPNISDNYIVADAKVELIKQLEKSGFAVLNIDDDSASSMDVFSPTHHIVKFGLNSAAQFNATEINFLGPDGLEFIVNNYYRFELPVYSSTSVSNALAAIATARILNFEFDEIIKGLKENFQLIPGRGNLIDLGDIYILDHTYNATLNSVSKACESLVQFQKYSDQLILVLGDIEGFWNNPQEVHLNLGYYISALPINIVITTGDSAKYIGEGIRKINHNKKIVKHCDKPGGLSSTVRDFLSSKTTLTMIGGKSLNLGLQLNNIIEKLK